MSSKLGSYLGESTELAIKVFLIRHYLTIDGFHNHIMILCSTFLKYNPAKKKECLCKTWIFYFNICKSVKSSTPALQDSTSMWDWKSTTTA